MTTKRYNADSINDQALDELYGQRDRARDALRHLMRYLPAHTESDDQHVDRTPPTAVRDLVDALAAALPDWDPAEERDFVWRQYQLTHRVLTRRLEQADRQVAEYRAAVKQHQAEAAIERVQQACHDLPYEHGRRILAALDAVEQQLPDGAPRCKPGPYDSCTTCRPNGAEQPTTDRPLWEQLATAQNALARVRALLSDDPTDDELAAGIRPARLRTALKGTTQPKEQ
ncbi:hypothetical protein ACIOC2_01370 [Streptomyces sp. NPDC088337]|uniref:hypothetical protein n=1 Tax=unclassified Streptomyces TaxID=2593676 RepID=UPI0037F7CD40